MNQYREYSSHSLHREPRSSEQIDQMCHHIEVNNRKTMGKMGKMEKKGVS